jgi:nicotinamidase-related amidase
VEALRLDRAALVMIDILNDGLHPDGFYARHGWRTAADFEANAELMANCERLVARMHELNRPVVFVRMGFRPDYTDCALSPSWIARGIRGAFIDGTWGADFMEPLTPEERDYVS